MLQLYRFKLLINQSIYLQNIYNRFKSILHVVPFYLVEERCGDENAANHNPRLDMNRVDVKVLSPKEIQILSENPEVKEASEFIPKKINNDWLCMGVKYDESVVAYMWCNLHECNDRLLQFNLKGNEAYLTFAYTFKAFRGKNIAPFLRRELYKYLQTLGRNKFYSITEYLNKPAVRFKKKLNARLLKLYLYICLMNNITFRLVLKYCP